MRKRPVPIRIKVLGICVIVSALLIAWNTREQLGVSFIEKDYGLPLTWRTTTKTLPEASGPGGPTPETTTQTDTQKLLIDLLIVGSATTILSLAAILEDK